MELDWRFGYTIVVAGISVFLASRSFIRLFRLLRLGQNEALEGSVVERLKLFAKNVLGQRKLFKDFWPGLQHALIFWGFIIVTIGTAEHLIEGLFHGFSFAFLGELYHWIVLAQEWAHPVILLAVFYGFFRRLVLKPKRLALDWDHQKDALLILSLTGLLMLANMLTFAAYFELGNAYALPEWRPVSSFLASTIFSAQVSRESLEALGHFGWALHLATVFFFLVYIPSSKHLHVFAAGPNFLFARLDSKGSFKTINFEDETVESYGVSKIQDFTWKDLLDTYSCTSCGRCNEFCPTANTDKPLKPMKFIEDLKSNLFRIGDEVLAGKEISGPALISEESGITHETVWACTSCRACVEACPVGIEHIDKIVDLRRNLVMMEGSMPAELQGTMRNWETQSNPWGISQDARDEWAKDLQVPRVKDHPNAEYLFYVGCAGSFDARNRKISTAFVKILREAKIDFAILGKEEVCNGETARRCGNEYLAKAMIDSNIEIFKNYNIKKIITICPHCFNTYKNEYPEFGYSAEIVHHTEFIQKLLDEGKIVPKKSQKKRVAFHDSCYLGRYNDVFEAPRQSIRAIPGMELAELPRNRKEGFCCGAGGGRMWMEETIGKRVNVERTEEALAQKPDVIAAACPFCQTMLTDGVNEKGVESVEVKDIAEIVAESL